MTQKLLKAKKSKIELRSTVHPRAQHQIALVATYKNKQLAWIKKNGVYNYPVKDGDEFDPAAFAQIKELWLYADTKGRRHCFTAEFVGKMTREEFLAAYPTYVNIGRAASMRPPLAPKGRARAPREPYKAYYIFKTTFLDYGPRLDAPDVLVRAADFATGYAKKIKKAVDAYHADGEFAPLAAYLPTELSQVPRERLRVCEAAVQMNFFHFIDSDVAVRKAAVAFDVADVARANGKLTCVEICAGAGGQAIGLERAGFSHVALVEYESDYCDVLKRNQPAWNVICSDVRQFDGRPYRGVDLLAGGVPCPPFSVASRQLGQADERDLFPEALRLIGEIMPKAVMIENVRGLLDPKFDDYRNSILRRIEGFGYVAQIKLLHASDYGVPQIRPRVVIVGIRKDLNSTFSYPHPSDCPAPTVGEALHDLMAARGWRGVNEWARRANAVAPTIVGGSKKHGGPDLGPTRARRAWAELGVDGLGVANEPPHSDFVGNPKLTKEMIAVIQGFPREWNFGKKKTAACRMIGNAFPPPVAEAVGIQIRRCLNHER